MSSERDHNIGDALRSLEVGESRKTFWDELNMELAQVDQADADDGVHRLETAVSRSKNDSGAGPWWSPIRFGLAAAAAVALLAGFAVLMQSRGGDEASLTVANEPTVVPTTAPVPTEVNDGDEDSLAVTLDEDSATEAAPPANVPGVTAPLVDYGQTPTVIELPPGSWPVTAAPGRDVTVIGSALQPERFGLCGESQRGLLLAVGHRGELITTAADSIEAGTLVRMHGPTAQAVRSSVCGDFTEGVQVGRLEPDGLLTVQSFVQPPEGLQFVHKPVWAFDGSQLHLNAIGETTGEQWLVSYPIAENGQVEGDPVASVSDPLLLADLPGDHDVVAVDGQIVGPGISWEYGDNAPLDSFQIEVSFETGHVALARSGELLVSNGESYAGGSAGDEVGEILDIEWSPTGQLLAATDGAGVFAFDPVGELDDGLRFSSPLAVEGTIWRKITIADNGAVVAISDGEADQATSTLMLRFAGGSSEEPPAVADDARFFAAPDQSVGDQPLTLRSMGAIQTGMTVAEAEAAVGGTLLSFADLGGCGYAVLAGDPLSPSFMVTTYNEDGPDSAFRDGIIQRIELGLSNQTLSGVRIGNTKDEVLAAYGAQIVVSPHHYSFQDGGEYLTFVPVDAADADYRVVMETFDDKVTHLRSGLLPAVEWVEGCA